MKSAPSCPTCSASLPAKSQAVKCSCGTVHRITKNGDVGFQIDSWPPTKAAFVAANGELKRAERRSR